MYSISKQFSFSASHRLSGLREDHPCSRLHGHNYRVEVELSSKSLEGPGFIKDYGELKPFQDYLDQNLDHRHLNDIFPFNPTAELLAAFLFNKAQALFGPIISKVSVSETEKTWASYSVDQGSHPSREPASPL